MRCNRHLVFVHVSRHLLNLSSYSSPALSLCLPGDEAADAREAGRAAGTRPAVYNAANEACVEAFHAGRIPFTAIVDTVAEVLHRHGDGNSGSTCSVDQVDDIEQVLAADAWAREAARSVMMEATAR